MLFSVDYKLRVTQATYNIHNDQITLWLDNRYRPAEEDKKNFGVLLDNLRKSYGPGRKVIYGRWTPSFESFCLNGIWPPQSNEDYQANGLREGNQKLHDGLEIDFICEPDDAEARAERYQKYAENADKSALGARDRWLNANTARRMRLAGGKSISESERSEYWWGKVAAVVSHANYMEKTASIITKLQVLEKDINGFERELPEYVGSPQDKGARKAKWPATCARYAWDQKEMVEKQGILPDKAAEIIEARKEKIVTYYRNYVEHLKRWQEYLMMYLEEAGGEMPAPEPRKKPRKATEYAKPSNCEKGGGYYDWYRKTWRKIVRVNPQSLSIEVPDGKPRKVELAWRGLKPTEFMSKAAYELYLLDGKPRPGE